MDLLPIVKCLRAHLFTRAVRRPPIVRSRRASVRPPTVEALEDRTVPVTNSWNGSVSNLWNVAGNWALGVPVAGQDVSITNPTNTPVVLSGTAANIDSLTASVTVDLEGTTLTLTGGGTPTTGGLSLSNSATLTLTGGGTLSITTNSQTFGSSDNTGAVVFGDTNSSNAVTVASGKQLTVASGFAIEGKTGTLNGSGSYVNNGTIEALNSGTISLASSFSGSGTIQGGGNSTAGTINLNGSTVAGNTLTTQSGGVVQNGGTTTLNGVTISTGSTLTLLNDTTTILEGTIADQGNIAQNSSGSDTDIQVSGAVSLTGGGTLTMSNTTTNRIYSLNNSTSDALTNANATIQGAGQIGVNNLTLVNQATIDADVSNTLTVNPAGGVTNTGTIEASAGGTLALASTISTAGTILATGTGSVVNLNGATINGDTITTSSGGVVENNGTATLNGVTISTGSTLTLLNDTTTVLKGTITDQGNIAQNSSGSDTDIQISGSVSLTGGGTLTLSNTTTNRIYSLNNSTSDALTNANATIQGAGQIGVNNLTLVNQATIDADVSNTLTVNPAGGVTNTGTIEASASGQLVVSSVVTNAGGTLLSTGSGSVASLAGGTINGGTLTTSSSGTMDAGSSTLNAVTISTGSTVTVQNDFETTLQGTITNNGTLFDDSTGSDTDIIISGTVTHTGGGSITMSNSTANRIFGTGGTLINDTSNTIQGAGQIGIGGNLALNNKGTIDANVSNSLTISSTSAVTNSGTLEATAGGTLALASTINNTSTGTIVATDKNSVANLSGVTVNGGTITTNTLNTSTAGVVENNGTATLNGITVSAGSTLTLLNDTATVLEGTITDKGNIAQNSSGSDTDIQVSGAVSLTGGGTLTMSNTTTNRIYSLNNSTSDALTNANATIQGAGQIGVNNLTLVNQATIDADVSNTLTVNPAGGVTNTGTIEASAGGQLVVSSVVTNAGGTLLSTGSGSVASLAGGTINGGTLTTSSSGTMDAGGGTLNAVTISSGSTVTVQNDFETTLQGTITNNGTLFEDSTGSDTDIHLSGNVTLNGTGTLSMSNVSTNRIFGNTGTEQLTNGAQHTIKGSGQLGIGDMSLVNNGTILANQSNRLLVQPNATGFTNNGTVQVLSGDTLTVTGGGALTNFASNTNTLTGGTYLVAGTFQFDNANIVTNAATIVLNGAPSAILNNQTSANGLANFATNAAAGNFTLENGRTLTTPGAFSNAGAMTIDATGGASKFTASGAYTQSGGTTTLVGGGTLASLANTVTISAGTLQGTGNVTGNVSNSGTLSPGTSTAAGKIAITGSYVQTSNGTFTVKLGGTSGPGTNYDQLTATGTATLAGTISASLFNGYTPAANDLIQDVIDFASKSGDFTTQSGFSLGNNLFLQEQFNPMSNPVRLNLVVHQAPVGSNQTVNVPENASNFAITLTSTDPNNDPLTFNVTTNPTHGTLGGTAPNLTYTPTANYFGPDSLQFTVTDQTTGLVSTPATVTITVVAPPVANGQTVNVTENASNFAITVTANDPNTNPTQTPLTYAVVQNVGHGQLTQTGNGPNFSYTPTANYFGPDSFTFTATNQAGVVSNTATVTIAVIAPPVASSSSVNVTENTAKAIAMTASDPNNPPLSLTYSITTNPAHGTLGSVSGNTVTYTPAANYFGPDSFQFEANNGTSNSNIATVSITVVAPPVANGQTVNVTENASNFAITVTANDPNTNPTQTPLTYAVVQGVGHGQLTQTGTGPNFSYTPTANYFGPDSFTFTASNQAGVVSNTATVSIHVVAPPVANGQTVNVPENASNFAITVTANDPNTNPTQTPLTYAVVQNVGHGQLTQTSNGPNFSYTPTTNYSGPDSFTFTATNQAGVVSNTATVTINVTSSILPPVASNSSVNVTENTAQAIAMTASDPNNPPLSLTYSITTDPTHGTLGSISGNTVTYTPAANYFGPDSFQFEANNGTSNSNVATVSITVVAPPVANGQTVKVPENASNFAITVTANDPNTNPTQTPLTYAVVQSVGHGQLSQTGNGPNFSYTPTTNYIGPDSFTFTATNQAGVVSNTATVTINVNAESQATITGVSVQWGTVGSAALQTAADGVRLLPAGRSTDLPWRNIQQFTITLSQAASLAPGDVSATGITVANYGPVTISGSGTTYTITLAQPIAVADRVTLTIGNAGITTYTRRLDVLPGDVNDDGVVNTTDGVLILANTTPAHPYNVFDDFNGDGSVNTTDFILYRPFIGTTLPSLPPQLAAGGEGPGAAASLTPKELAPVLAAAIDAWTAAGLPAADVARLHAVTVQITTLPAGYLGGTASGSTTVALSANAAGWGWFIDPTPGPDTAFAQPAAADEWLAAPSSPAAGHEDLLTVVMHELGHILELGDLNPATSPTDLMAATLATGVRRLPSLPDVTAVLAAPAGTTLAGPALTRIVAPAGPGIFDARPAQTLASLSVVAALLSPPAQIATVPGEGGTAPLPTAAPTATTAAPAAAPARPSWLPVAMNFGGHGSGTQHDPGTDDPGDDLTGGAV